MGNILTRPKTNYNYIKYGNDIQNIILSNKKNNLQFEKLPYFDSDSP